MFGHDRCPIGSDVESAWSNFWRLQAARQRMLMDGIDATNAAYEVGYESVSQFSREYSRFFGQPPMRDVKTLRDAKVAAINAA